MDHAHVDEAIWIHEPGLKHPRHGKRGKTARPSLSTTAAFFWHRALPVQQQLQVQAI